jgi:hypothetical protein
LLGVWTGTNLIGYGKESKSFIAETTDIETLAVTATVLKFAIARGLTWSGARIGQGCRGFARSAPNRGLAAFRTPIDRPLSSS